jgi:hypothetical protein
MGVLQTVSYDLAVADVAVMVDDVEANLRRNRPVCLLCLGLECFDNVHLR